MSADREPVQIGAYQEPAQVEPILTLVSVAPIKQPLKINDTIHYLYPLQGYGVVSQYAIQRDWDTYAELSRRLSSGETLTTDEAMLGDLAVERLVRFALPTMTEEEWQGLDGTDKQSVTSFFFEITAIMDKMREAKKLSLLPILISGESSQT